jgi:hypothetical protein
MDELKRDNVVGDYVITEHARVRAAYGRLPPVWRIAATWPGGVEVELTGHTQHGWWSAGLTRALPSFGGPVFVDPAK